MWQRVGGLLLVVLILSDGKRKRSRVGANSSLEVGANSSLQLQVSESSLRSSIDGTLTELDKEEELDLEPADVLIDLIKGIATFKWDEPIGEQMKDLVKDKLVEVGQTLASFVHPVLGIAFSIFAGLFGLYDSDSDSTMIQEILAEVDKMISSALTSFQVKYKVKSGLLAAADQVNQAAASGNWNILPDNLTPRFNDVFFPCSDDENGNACQELWQGKHSGELMVYEIHFLELMITSVAEIVRYEGEIINGLKEFMFKTRNMAELAQKHMSRLWNTRTNWASSEFGLKEGRASCYGRLSNKKCIVHGATDFWRGSLFCARAEFSHSGNRATKQQALQEEHHKCYMAQRLEIIEELQGFNTQISEIKKTADAMYQAF